MSTENNLILKIDLYQICKFSLSSSLFLANEIIYNMPTPLKVLVNQERLREEVVDFYKDYKNLIYFKTDFEPIKYVVSKINPYVQIGIHKEINSLENIKKDIDELNFVININTVQFFFEKLWPLIVEKIVLENISLNDYVQKEVRIIKFAVDKSFILEQYKEFENIELAENCFVDDLSRIFYYSGFAIKEAQRYQKDEERRIIITI